MPKTVNFYNITFKFNITLGKNVCSKFSEFLYKFLYLKRIFLLINEIPL